MPQTITNSAAQQREHEYVNTTTRWDNNPLQAVDRLVTPGGSVSKLGVDAEVAYHNTRG